ncbi:MAG: FlhC family transcriptional regulator [Pseudomonadota bacterium]|jgi:flagellar transcriptional activator FlhC
MMSTRADRQLRALRLAQDCAQLGARVRTIHHLTGLNPRDVQRLFFNDPQAIPRGRPPNSLEWYHGANLIAKAESSIFMSMYRRLRSTGFGAAETLVSAYRGYQAICQCPHRISFDRAFDLASHTDGIWLASIPVFDVIACPTCGSDVLMAIGTLLHSGDNCPFCKLVQRYSCDPRLQASFPNQVSPAAPATVF